MSNRNDAMTSTYLPSLLIVENEDHDNRRCNQVQEASATEYGAKENESDGVFSSLVSRFHQSIGFGLMDDLIERFDFAP